MRKRNWQRKQSTAGFHLDGKKQLGVTCRCQNLSPSSPSSQEAQTIRGIRDLILGVVTTWWLRGVQNTDTVWPSFRHTAIVFKAKPMATNLEVAGPHPASSPPASKAFRLSSWVRYLSCGSYLLTWRRRAATPRNISDKGRRFLRRTTASFQSDSQ